jgi:hypothetical protein
VATVQFIKLDYKWLWPLGRSDDSVKGQSAMLGNCGSEPISITTLTWATSADQGRILNPPQALLDPRQLHSTLVPGLCREISQTPPVFGKSGDQTAFWDAELLDNVAQIPE